MKELGNHGFDQTSRVAVGAVDTACSSSAGGGSTAGALTVEECRRYFECIYGLDGMNASAVLGEEVLSKDSATCAESGSVTRRHFDCAMAAESVDALQVCGASNT